MEGVHSVAFQRTSDGNTATGRVEQSGTAGRQAAAPTAVVVF
jgi:hypothetical protein